MSAKRLDIRVYPRVEVCPQCWADRASDRFPDVDPLEHPRLVIFPTLDELVAHRMVGFDTDTLLVVCGERWTKGGLDALLTGQKR